MKRTSRRPGDRRRLGSKAAWFFTKPEPRSILAWSGGLTRNIRNSRRFDSSKRQGRQRPGLRRSFEKITLDCKATHQIADKPKRVLNCGVVKRPTLRHGERRESFDRGRNETEAWVLVDSRREAVTESDASSAETYGESQGSTKRAELARSDPRESVLTSGARSLGRRGARGDRGFRPEISIRRGPRDARVFDNGDRRLGAAGCNLNRWYSRVSSPTG